MQNRDKGLTSIVALHDADAADLLTWSENYGADTVLLKDEQEEIFNLYKHDSLRPQYILIDSDLTVLFKSSLPDAKAQAQRMILERLD